jgi:hypothetical protein
MIFKRNNLSSCFPFTGFISFSNFIFDILCRSDHGLLHFHVSNVNGENRSAHWKDGYRSSCLDRKENERVY